MCIALKEGITMLEPLFYKCNECATVYEMKKHVTNMYICMSCGRYETLDIKKRLKLIIDDESFQETNIKTEFINRINFPGYCPLNTSVSADRKDRIRRTRKGIKDYG